MNTTVSSSDIFKTGQWHTVKEMTNIKRQRAAVSDGAVNSLALQSLFDGEFLATVPAFELLLLCAGPLVQTLKVGSQDLLAGKAALAQQTGVVFLLYYQFCQSGSKMKIISAVVFFRRL